MAIESTGFDVSSVQEAKDNHIDLKKLGVRMVSLRDYLGVDVKSIRSGKTMDRRKECMVHMASYVYSAEAIQGLRNKLLSHK